MVTQHVDRHPHVEDVVERDIDGIWFPAKVVAVHQADRRELPSEPRQVYDLVYLDDDNRECEVPAEELRLIRPGDKIDGSSGAYKWARNRRSMGHDKRGIKPEAGAPNSDSGKEAGEEGVKENEYARDSGPKVTIHTSRGAFDAQEDGSATAYIINGPETNVAAGSGLRGIRWLRGP